MPSSRRSTLHPPPPLPENLSPLTASLALTPLPLGNTIFTNSYPLWQPTGARGIYGGSVIAQSLLAAIKTLPAPAVQGKGDASSSSEGGEEGARQLFPHSLHCYFVLNGDPNIPVVYRAKDLRTGRSFATREVQASQNGKPIFVTCVSFQKPVPKDKENVVKHQAEFPRGVPRAEELPTELDKVEAALKKGKIDEDVARGWKKKIEKDVFEWRQIPVDWDAKEVPVDKRTIRYWARLKDGRGMSELDHLVAFAYASDSYFIGTVTRTNKAAHWDRIGMMVSLDHSIWFHAVPRTDRWMLLEMTSSWAGEERAFVQMKAWDLEGRLLAECTQEGLVRLRDGREGESFEEEKVQEKIEKSKL